MQIEILTAKEGGPSRDWLNSHVKYLITSKARAKIHQWFKHQNRETNIQLGREMVNREFRRLGINLHRLSALLFRLQNIANVIDVCRVYENE